MTDAEAAITHGIPRILAGNARLTAEEIRQQLADQGLSVTRRDINRHLYAHNNASYQVDGRTGSAPLWLIRHEGEASKRPPPRVPTGTSLGTLPAPDALEPLDRLANQLAAISPRNKEIYAARRLRRSPTTLEELARAHGLSRERIRQIEEKVHKRLQASLAASPGSVPDGIVRIEEALPAASIHQVIGELKDGNPVSDLAIAAAAYLHGLDRLVRWGFVGTKDAWASLVADLQELSGLHNVPGALLRRRIERHIPTISSTELAALVVGTESEHAPEPLSRRAVRTNADRVTSCLEAAGKPLTRVELAQATGLAERQVRSVLGRTEVFAWVGRARFAPRSWGLPQYRGTEQALVDALTEMGGFARADELIRIIRDRFDCTEASAQVYLGASGRFRKDGDLVSLIADGDYQVTPGYPSRQRRVYSDLRGGLIWAIDVDDELLRGSGRSVPPSVAAYFQVTPTNPQTLLLPGGPVIVKLAAALVTTTSLRKTVEATRVARGDRMLLRLPEGADWSLEIARAGSDPTSALLPFVGLQDAPGNVDTVLARACWQDDPTLLRETLWDRREERLLELLGAPPSDPRGHIVVLDRLDALFPGKHPSRRDLAASAGIGDQGLAPDGGSGKARLSARQTTLLLRRISHLISQPVAAVERRLFDG